MDAPRAVGGVFNLYFVIFILSVSLPVGATPTIGKAEFKQIIVESIHIYKESTYTGANDMQVGENLEAQGWSGPELVLGRRIQAMLRADYEGALATWSKEDQEDLIKRDRAEGRNPKFWKDYWAKGFVGASARLVSRVEWGDFVILKYVFIRDGKTVFDSSVAFYKDGQAWVGSNRLKDDPVYQNWESGKKRVQRAAPPPTIGVK